MAIDIWAHKQTAESSFMSTKQFNEAMDFAKKVATKFPRFSQLEFSRLIVNIAVNTETRSDYYNGAIKVGLKKAVANDLADLFTSPENRKAALNYCFLYCLKVISARYSRKVKDFGKRIDSHGNSRKKNEDWLDYFSEAYLKYNLMMRGGWVDDKNGGKKFKKATLNLSEIDDTVRKHKGDNNYTYFKGVSGWLSLELLNTNRDIYTDDLNHGLNTYNARDTKKDKITYTSFDAPGASTTDDDGYSRADKLAMDYMNSSGNTNEINVADIDDDFMNDWLACCKDKRWESSGTKEIKDGAPQTGRKAKAFKFLILNALGKLNYESRKDMYNAIYGDKSNPKQYWDREITGTSEGTSEFSVAGILDDYEIDVNKVIEYCNLYGVDRILGPLKGIGEQLPDNSDIEKVSNFGKEESKSHRDILKESRKSNWSDWLNIEN